MRFLNFTIALLLTSSLSPAADWSQFRGPELSVSREGTPPTEWSVPDQKNMAWQADLPGRGPSSPIVVGERVVVTASGGAKQDELYVLCFDLNTGNKLWQRDFWATGRTACHPQSAVAAPTPASDGQFIYAYYSSNDLICLDLEGNLQWLRGLTYDFPHSGNDVGMSSSPVVIEGVVVVQCESQGDSFAIGIDAASGQTRWRVAREPAASWTSPVAVPAQGNQPAMVLLQSGSGLSAHEARSGVELWRYEGSCDVIPSPTFRPDGVYVVTAGAVTALDLKGSGTRQVSPRWSSNRLAPGAASPVVHEGRIYVVNRAGVLKCAEAASGETIWELRLTGEFWATPVVAGDLMFLLSQSGTVQVVRLGKEQGEIVAENAVGETLQASPAVAGDSLIVRSDQHLWRFAAQ